MEIIKDLLGTVAILIGSFWIVYILAYAVELGKMKARRKLKVCDICFKKAEAMDKVAEKEIFEAGFNRGLQEK